MMATTENTMYKSYYENSVASGQQWREIHTKKKPLARILTSADENQQS